MDTEERQVFESQLQTQALNPLAAAYQNALVAREPAERFASLGYLHEVILKCLAAQAYGRARVLKVVSPELVAFLRDDFRQPSAGHWAQLLAQSQKALIQARDRPARFLDGLMRKKLRDTSVLELDRMITELLGHTRRDKTKVTLAEAKLSQAEAEKDLDRKRSLHSRGGIPSSEVDTAFFGLLLLIDEYSSRYFRFLSKS